MSNHLAIATVTAVLRGVLTDAASIVSGGTVTYKRPDGQQPNGSAPTSVNIFLYHVTPNGTFRNADLPTRRPDGTLVQRPQTALDLHYLLSFYGDESKLEPQRLLGSVARTLHARPLLSRGEITTVISNLSGDPNLGFVVDSDLAEQIDLIRFTPLALSLEELSKLWSVFFQVPYALSVAYQAGVVLIETDETPQRALPVMERNLYVKTFRHPLIERVVSAAGPDKPIVAGSTLLIQGKQLRGDETLVLMGGAELTPMAVSDLEVSLPLPGTARAGVAGLQVVHRLQMGSPPVPHRGFESNVASFVIHPTITSKSATASLVNLGVSPTVRAGQRIALLMNEWAASPPPTTQAYRFDAKPPASDTNTLQFAISGVKGAGTTYILRVQVDGAESPVDLDPGSMTFGPTVTIP